MSRTVSTTTEERNSPYPLIFKELTQRYEELTQAGKSLESSPRISVVGECGTHAARLFESLFGTPCGEAEHRGDNGAWQVQATFNLEDVPGLGLVGADGSEERALAYLREADSIVLTMGVNRRPTDLERAVYSHIKRLDRPHAVVVYAPVVPDRTASNGKRPGHKPGHKPAKKPGDTKTEQPLVRRVLDSFGLLEVMDKQFDDPEREEAWRRWQGELQRSYDNQDLVSYFVDAASSPDLMRLARQIHDKLPTRLRLGMLRILAHRPSQDVLIADMITSLSNTAGFFGIAPIPYADVLAITPVQILLVCRIAAAHGKRITWKQAWSFLTTSGLVAGAGLGFRTLYRQLLKLIPGEGTIAAAGLGAAVGWSGTQVIGHAANAYFKAGSKLTPRQAADKAKEEVRENQTLPSLVERD